MVNPQITPAFTTAAFTADHIKDSTKSIKILSQIKFIIKINVTRKENKVRKIA
jgi:hypothetical protein